MKYMINLSAAKDSKEIQQLIAENLPVPDYYGKNLDALYDVLTGYTEKMTIIFLNHELPEEADDEMRQKKQKYIRLLQHVCEDAMEENASLGIKFVRQQDCGGAEA